MIEKRNEEREDFKRLFGRNKTTMIFSILYERSRRQTDMDDDTG